MRSRVLLIIAIFALIAPAFVDAQDWIFRVRGISVQPNESSDAIGDTGTEVAVGSKSTVEVDLTYMFSSNLGLEVIAATTPHDLTASGGALGGANLGEVKVLPPTFTLQYYLAPDSSICPYIGAGLNFTLFYSYDLSGDLAGLGVTDIDFDNSFGLAGNVGLNINLNEKWLLNADAKYIQIGTTADIQTADGTLAEVDVDINPWVFGLGVGFRF